MSSFLLSVAIAVATGAALYYFFMHLQRINQKVDALGLHMRKLEGLVWAYNIRGQTSMHDDESDQSAGEYHQAAAGQPDDSEESDEVEHIPADVLMEQVRAARIFSFSIPSEAGDGPTNSDGAGSRVEELPDEATETIAPTTVAELALPEVVSFDAFNAAASRLPVTATGAETTETTETSVSSTTESSSAVNEVNGVNEGTGGTGGTDNRVYADTYQNRKLGRVGKPY